MSARLPRWFHERFVEVIGSAWSIVLSARQEHSLRLYLLEPWLNRSPNVRLDVGVQLRPDACGLRFSREYADPDGYADDPTPVVAYELVLNMEPGSRSDGQQGRK